MWRRVQIEGFRAFQRFDLGDLGRINLLVGENNAGKTSALEAIELLNAGGDPEALWNMAARRGERPETSSDDAVDITHLFFGHGPGRLAVRGEGRWTGHDATSVEIKWAAEPQQGVSSADKQEPEEIPRQRLWGRPKWNLQVRFSSSAVGPWEYRVPVGARGELPLVTTAWNDGDVVPILDGPASPSPIPAEALKPTRFVTTQSLQPAIAIALFNRILLNPEEALVIEALRTIEPDIERVASVVSGQPRTPDQRGGLMIKRRGADHRIPIGSLGDGIWRLFGVVLCLVAARDGILLIDEIDTGLHYTVLGRMWKLVMKTAERLNVQVFATTHSRDCYESLAAICREDVVDGSQVSIQRIEKGKTAAVAFTEAEIVRAAERGIEVR